MTALHTAKHELVKIIEEAAAQIGADVFVEEFGRCGIIHLPNGATTLFHYNRLNLNGHASVRIARDKAYTTNLLRHFGYRVPDERTFFRDGLIKKTGWNRGTAKACTYADEIGWPVVVKPARLSQGRLVDIVYDTTSLKRAATKVLKYDLICIVQKFYKGRDYRIVVLDGEVISAYQRLPLSVTGDGTSTISQLLIRKQKTFITAKRDTVLSMDSQMMITRLSRLGLTHSSIPGAGVTIELLDIANLSAGGESRDILAELHYSFRELADAIARDMDLRLCGIDIIGEDLSLPATGQQYVILEVNSSPGLDNYAESSRRQHEHVVTLYAKMLLALMR